MMQTPDTIFKKLCKKIEIEFIDAKLNSGEKVESAEKDY